MKNNLDAILGAIPEGMNTIGFLGKDMFPIYLPHSTREQSIIINKGY